MNRKKKRKRKKNGSAYVEMFDFAAEVGNPLQSVDVHFDGGSEIKIESHSGGRMENN